MAPNLGCRGTESPGWSDILPKISAWDMMHEWVCYCDEAANHQLPIAVVFWIIQIVSVEKCSSLMQNLMHIPCCTHSVILNAMATQYTCSLQGTYCPHWLVQWSRHCSHMCNSSALSLGARLYQCCTNNSCYINNGGTFLGNTLYVQILLVSHDSHWIKNYFSLHLLITWN